MASPYDYLNDPAWHQKPIAERDREMSAADPGFAKLPEDRRMAALSKAAQRYGRGPAVGQAAPPPGPMARVGQDLKLGFRSGEADVARTVGSVAGLVGAHGFEQQAEDFAKSKEPTPQEMQGRDSLLDQVAMGVGSAPASVIKYAPAELAGKYAPLAAGAIGAVSHRKEGLRKAVQEGVKDALTFGVMGKASKLPTRASRALGSAAAAGATAAVFEGGDIKQATAAAVMGGAFGAVAKNEKPGQITPEQAKALLEGGVDSISHVSDLVKRVIAPQTRGPEARREANIIRANSSDVYRQADIADYALRKASKHFRLMPDKERLPVLFGIEEPKEFPLDPKTRAFTDTMEKINNSVRDELIEEGSYIDPKTGTKKYTVLGSVKRALEGDPDAVMRAYYEHYLPHLFKNPEQASEVMKAYYSGKRPLPGPATFTHQRKYPTLREALQMSAEAGKPLELVTTDPVELYMLKWREMKRFTSALRIVREMEDSQLLSWEPPGKRGPKGWVQVRESRAFQRMAKDASGHNELSAVAWAPEGAARVLNNYLSPGLRGNQTFGPVFRGLMGFNNVLNQAQLGFSAFHLGFTSVDAVTSRFALGLEQAWQSGSLLKQGKAADAARMAGKSAASIGKSVTVLPALVENVKAGLDMRKEWLKPGSSKNPQTVQLVEAMRQAGGGLSLDPIYRTNMSHRVYESMRAHGSFIGALLGDPLLIPKALGMANEKFAGIIMNQFVPWQKLGVFHELAKFELDKMPGGFEGIGKEGGVPLDQARQVFARAWDSVDNRMGMLRYDNLFWEKWVKDMSMATIRSVGWNIGTIRELGGGVADWGRLGKAVLSGKNKEFTHRMAYTLAMPAITGLIGGMIHYAYNGKAPQEMMDWFFPRTGRKDEFGRDERISVPSYVKDSYHMLMAARDFATGAGGGKALAIVTAKTHSTWGAIADMLNNRDFYNTEIANNDDPFIKRATDYAMFLGKQYNPFAFTNILRERKLKFPLSEQVGTFFGFVPAPADIKKTPAERMATEIMAENLPKRANTREEREHQDNRRELERRIRTQNDWEGFAEKAIDEGTLSQDDVLRAADKAAGLPLDRSFQRMRLRDAVRVWKVSSADEKRRLKPLLEQKVENDAETIMALPKGEREKLVKQVWAMLNEPIGGQ